MRRKTMVVMGALGTLLIGATTFSALADGPRHGGGGSPPWADQGGHGMRMFEQFDQDGDGRVTAEEIAGVRDERLAAFDSDGDGALSLEEYEALWLDAMRTQMVRGFQRHDVDGDGRVTAEEFRDRFEGMVSRLDDDGDGAVTREELRQMHGRHHGGRDRGGDRDDAN
jgi:Ca2+-binding EF-hand superfamily protein